MKFKEGDRVCVEGDVIVRDGKTILIEFGDGSKVWMNTVAANIYHAAGECEVKNV